MKINNRHIIICMFLILNTAVYAQSKKEKETLQKQQLKELVNSKNYKIDVQTVYPHRSSSRQLTSPYSLEVKNDSIFSHLPFFGRAYSIPYGGGDGLRFDAPISEYEISYNKKGVAKVNITTRTSEDQYNFLLTIYPNEAANINVNMTNRESISFSGKLERESK